MSGGPGQGASDELAAPPVDSVFADALRALPKVELHVHLEGCVRPSTFVELARRYDVPMPTADLEHVYDYHDMVSFMEVFERLGSAIRNRDDVARITYESLTDAARGSNVLYREVFCNPSTHPDLAYRDLVAGFTDGANDAQSATGIVARLIPSVFRGHGPEVSSAMVREVLDGERDLVVGIGMDGDETTGPPELFTQAYALARAGGLGVTAHAGERFSAQEVRDCLDLLGCTRIDHGYGLVRDSVLLERVRSEQIHVTCAWLSTTYHYDGPAQAHPIWLLHEAGVSMSLGSDDPAMGGTDLAGDYLAVARELGLSFAQLAAQSTAALDASWLAEPEKDLLRVRLNAATCPP